MQLPNGPYSNSVLWWGGSVIALIDFLLGLQAMSISDPVSPLCSR
jgi:hypothetical protein